MVKLSVFQAYDRALIREVETDSEQDLERKLARAARAFGDRAGWLKPHQRIAILEQLALLVEAQRDGFATLIAREGGKPLADARVEAARAVDGVRNAIDELRNFGGREIPMGLTPASEGRWAFTTREPIGVVAAISAFNHPLNLIIHQVVPAIATGCPVLIKPASTTPLSCLEFVKLVHQAGLSEAWCDTIITGENSIAEKLATDPRVAFLSFIGSARVGWSLRSKLPPGTRCALEHGGAAPLLIDREVELDSVIEPVVKGGYYHAGQVCVSVQRIFVHEHVHDAFVERLSERVAALRVGDPSLAETEVGPLILPREVARVASWVEEARAAGARITTGGKQLGETTYQPTVIVDAPTHVKVSLEEVFGPVTCVYRVSDLAHAIEQANSLPVAFQASVFSKNLDVALRAAEQLDASTVLINDHTAFRVDWMPFAGRRHSGYGVGGIGYTMHDMTQHKMIVLRR
ncbi:MAG: aldehyde dehydrogenase family protein [Myxococcaceae bacterium]|nr:aldehyde dehydrogenase family protein [Myxococcaceae bacterium]